MASRLDASHRDCRLHLSRVAYPSVSHPTGVNRGDSVVGEVQANQFMAEVVSAAIVKLDNGVFGVEQFALISKAFRAQVTGLSGPVAYLDAADVLADKIARGVAGPADGWDLEQALKSMRATTPEFELTGRRFVSLVSLAGTDAVAEHGMTLEEIDFLTRTMEDHAFLDGQPAFFEAVRGLARQILDAVDGTVEGDPAFTSAP